MKLANQMTLDAAPDRLFALLTDVANVVPCLPGAQLEGSDGDTHHGSVKIKLGPITAAYSGTVRFMEVDSEARRVVLDARGVDQHGSGNAEAKVTAEVRPHDNGSLLVLETDLVVRGKIAQFGRGVLGDVSQKLMEQFASNISGVLATGPASASVLAPAATTSSLSADVATSANGLALVAMPLLKRAALVFGGLVAGLLIGRLLSARRGAHALVDDFVLAKILIGDQMVEVPARLTIAAWHR